MDGKVGWLLYAAAPGGGHHGVSGMTMAAMVGMCVFCLALASFYLGFCVPGVRRPNIQPTTNHLAKLLSPSIMVDDDASINDPLPKHFEDLGC